MAEVLIQELRKSYDQKVNVLKNITIDVKKGEFLVIVGPSGCGKSTLLRMIAGLESITSGNLFIDGKYMNDVAPAKRDIGMVFQDYALYPHMTVFENISFGLRIRKLTAQEVRSRVESVAELLEIQMLLQRKPAQLSGGQRQRVAIARALAKKPKVFLFDEPFSNLDAQLRAQMRVELLDLHQKIGSTTIFVTHDQMDAMGLADRIVLLRTGQVQQIGPPLTLYSLPANQFVATFIGTPGMNLINGNLIIENGRKYFKFSDCQIDLTSSQTPVLPGSYVLGVRPESIEMVASGDFDIQLKTQVVERYGHEFHVICRVSNQNLLIRVSRSRPFVISNLVKAGDQVNVRLNRSEIHWFEANEIGSRLMTTQRSDEKDFSGKRMKLI